MIVSADADGERLDQFLAGHVGSRSAAQRLIEAGRVTVDGAPRSKRRPVRVGERVEVAPGPDPEPVPPARFAVAYEDDDVLVVDKPAGVVVHPGTGHEEGTLVQALAGRVAGGDDPTRPGVIHRLDRDTSGLLIFARSPEAHTVLARALAERKMTREYLALVAGRPPARKGTIEAPLGRDRRVRTRMSTETDDPRIAVTHFEQQEALPKATLLRVRLDTGRTHQIRAHLRAIEHPVVGDPEYGTPGYGLERQFLHAARVTFTQPVTGAALEFASPLPPDLLQALERARLH